MGFTYNQESALKAGGTAKETGAYVGTIEAADYKRAKSGSAGLELSIKTQDGSEFNYLTLWYMKADGSEIKGGSSMINAIMGLTHTQALSERQVGVGNNGAGLFEAPELIGKEIGLLLQKSWYTKNDGGDGYKFEIRLPFNPKTKQTLKEQVSNAPAEMVDRMASTLTDKDERNQQPAQQASAQSFGAPNGAPAPAPQFGNGGNTGFDDVPDF